MAAGDAQLGLVYQTMCSSGVTAGEISIFTNPALLMQVQSGVKSGVRYVTAVRKSSRRACL